MKDQDGAWILQPCPSLATVSFADLRDTAITWLGRAGCTIPEIASISGHSLRSIYTILKHYLDLDESMAKSAIVRLVAWIEEQGIKL